MLAPLTVVIQQRRPTDVFVSVYMGHVLCNNLASTRASQFHLSSYIPPPGRHLCEAQIVIGKVSGLSSFLLKVSLQACFKGLCKAHEEYHMCPTILAMSVQGDSTCYF